MREEMKFLVFYAKSLFLHAHKMVSETYLHKFA